MQNLSEMDKLLPMRLVDYLQKTCRTPEWLAKEAGCTAQAAYKYIRGERIPRHDIMQRIHAATEGAVTANDFYDLPNT